MGSQYYQIRTVVRIIPVAFAIMLFAPVASAHIYLDTPDGDETFEVGSIVSVSWTVLQAHEMDNWDVEYSTTGAAGPYIPVATDLPEGDSSVGSVHTYDWTVPDIVSATVRIKAIQDLPGEEYYEDISDRDFSIVPLQSVSRLRLLRLNRPFSDLEVMFMGLPCTRISDLRICAEAPGSPRDYNDSILPFIVPGNGDLILFEFDSLLEAPGTPDQIVISKGANGTLVVEYFP
jgi:hypothetical protein